MLHSLRIHDAPDSQRRVYWFEDIEGEPWCARDCHSITGAVDRMRSKGGEVCFFVAYDVNHVRGLSLDKRALEKQTRQLVDR